MPAQHSSNRRPVIHEPRTGEMNCDTSTGSRGSLRDSLVVRRQLVRSRVRQNKKDTSTDVEKGSNPIASCF